MAPWGSLPRGLRRVFVLVCVMFVFVASDGRAGGRTGGRAAGRGRFQGACLMLHFSMHYVLTCRMSDVQILGRALRSFAYVLFEDFYMCYV